MKNNNFIYHWLMTGVWLIILMVVVGGITRLTQSGLSMVEWKPIVGAIPPLNEREWLEEFNKYQQSPEFKFYNSDFTLSDFKSIFFWEYLHRLIARIMGIAFLLPLVYMSIKRMLPQPLKKHLLIIFCWGLLQGLIGWLMVKSGLSNNPHVSHYRLALHFITALLLMGYIYFVALEVKNNFKKKSYTYNSLKFPFRIGVSVLILQFIYGAFVAGLKAGKMYTTFPKMGTQWIPQEFKGYYLEKGIVTLFENPGIVQLIHRILAGLIILLWVLFYQFKMRKNEFELYHSLYYKIGFIILIQITVGVTTLVFSVPIFIGVLHQFIAIVLFLACIKFDYSLRIKK